MRNTSPTSRYCRAIPTAAPRCAVNIKADRNRRNWYSVGAGYATDTGPRGTLTWENRRINTRGHRFNVLVQAAQVTKYQVQSNYIIPIGDPAVEKLTLQGIVEQRDLADVTTRNEYLQPGHHQGIGQLAVRAGSSRRCKTTGESAAETRTDRLLIPGIDIASVPKGYLGEPHLPTRPVPGDQRFAMASIGANTSFLQAHLTGVRVFNFLPKWHLLLRDEIGATIGLAVQQLPVVERFFAGGDNSVRGFAYNDLSPTQDVCQRVPTDQVMPTPTGGAMTLRERSRWAARMSSPVRSRSSATCRATSASPRSSITAMPSIGSAELRLNIPWGWVSVCACPS